ncbi:MAG: hypothetical protein JSC189_000328 [Candidatus Tokpelaia sp. JSC189]|nr:MAG: hypothetical protein JSC189_000328 [Candidatus Tokpelaia sp. JSC189]
MYNPHENIQKSTRSILARALQDFSMRDRPGRVLKDFSIQENSSPEFSELPPMVEIAPLKEEPLVEMPPPIDIEILRQEAFAQGEEKQREEMQAGFSERLKLIEEAHGLEINQLKSHMANLAAEIERGLEVGLKKIELDLSQQIAEILMAFINERLTQEAIRQFASKIAAESITVERPLIIEGNKELLGVLQALPDFDASCYRFKPTDAREIRVVYGDTVLSTRLAARLKELKELV